LKATTKIEPKQAQSIQKETWGRRIFLKKE
jgi:hypothetical protein